MGERPSEFDPGVVITDNQQRTLGSQADGHVGYKGGISMKGKFSRMLSGAAMAATFAAASAVQAGETVMVDPGTEITVETAEGIRGYISHPLIPVTFSGLWYIAPGTYMIKREAHVAGRRYALIPWARRQPNADVIREEKKGPGGCKTEVQHYAAIDIQTNTLHDRSWIYTGGDCDAGERWDKRLWLAPGFTFNGFQVREESASVASGRRAALEREKAAIEQRAQETEQEQRRQQEVVSRIDAPAKRQVGASVCIVRNGMGYAGYTEQVNEETGRIRIRVVRQFNPVNGRFLLKSLHEENIWEHPDNWYLCDF